MIMDKVAVITGGARGIGSAIAEEFSGRGFALVVNYYASEDKAFRLQANLEKKGRDISLVQADISTREGRQKIVNAALKKHSRIAVLVNNAGWRTTQKFTELDEETYDMSMAINLKGGIFLTQALLPHFQKGAAVVFTSSVVGFIGSEKGLDYVAAKTGVIGAVRTLARELAPDIRVNAVAPGYIDTELLAYDTPDKRRERIENTPLKRIGKAEDVARAVAFLASDQASFITGQVLHVNGGIYFG